MSQREDEKVESQHIICGRARPYHDSTKFSSRAQSRPREKRINQNQRAGQKMMIVNLMIRSLRKCLEIG